MIPAGRPAGTTTRIPSKAVAKVLAASGLSRERFAGKIGCTAKTLYNCLRDEVLPSDADTLANLKALAAEYGIKIP